jgi:hypothetical protein
MNSLISVLTVLHLLKLAESRFQISKSTRNLLFAGMLLPIGDYIIRFIRGDGWFFSGNLIFHSFIYQGLFWAVVSLLCWVYFREFHKSIKLLIPLLGLGIYLLFSIPATEYLTFFSPFSTLSYQANWVNSGYFVPTLVALLLWASRRWSDFSTKTVSRISLAILVLFLLQSGAIHNRIENNLPEAFRKADSISATSANLLMTEWNVVACVDGNYKAVRYHFVQGFREDVQEIKVYLHDEIVQNALLSPPVRNLFLFGFKNPVLNIEIQNEVSKIVISEAKPLVDLVWNKQADVIRNRSGRVIDLSMQYGSFF